MGEAAIAGALAVDYRGAGTVEFLLDAHGDFYFMEMNTRIQVEHPVTEEVTGEDLIEWQLRVAAGEKVTGGNRAPTGHSIECRINAEDPFRGFAPEPGPHHGVPHAQGRGVRFDTHVFAGYTVPPNYDSMIAKLIVRDADARAGHREDAPRARRVRRRGHPHDHPVPQAAHARRPLPRGRLRHQVYRDLRAQARADGP